MGCASNLSIKISPIYLFTISKSVTKRQYRVRQTRHFHWSNFASRFVSLENFKETKLFCIKRDVIQKVSGPHPYSVFYRFDPRNFINPLLSTRAKFFIGVYYLNYHITYLKLQGLIEVFSLILICINKKKSWRVTTNARRHDVPEMSAKREIKSLSIITYLTIGN